MCIEPTEVMDMKRLICLTAALLMLCASACAQVLPDAGAWLDVRVQQHMEDYAYSADYVCGVWVYPRDSRTGERMALWLMEALDAGYAIQKTTVDGEAAYRMEDSAGRYALMLPDYQGAVMLMVQNGMRYAPLEATPTPPPAATPAPAPAQGGTSGVRWEWVDVQRDCPSCANGRCDLCNGSGIYRLYGEEVICPILCTSCDGLGWYWSTEYQMVVD